MSYKTEAKTVLRIVIFQAIMTKRDNSSYLEILIFSTNFYK